MTNNLNTTNYSKFEITKKVDQPATEGRTSYRGFTSIDQEMERAIAMQWFSPSEKNIFHRGIVVKKS